jgi:radical SAM superfamily enzyme YgiQ (UPF0313 family)
MVKPKTLVITPPFLESFRPPISGAMICSILEECDHEVVAWDANIKFYNQIGYVKFYKLRNQFLGLEDLSKEHVDLSNEFINSYDFSKFDNICVSIFSSWSHAFTELLLERIRQANSSINIVLGGAGITQTYNKKPFGALMLEKKLCDYYIDGEGEIALPELFKGNITYSGINGTVPIQIEDINSLPIPNYDYYDLDEYDYLSEDNRDLFIYGSRGCVRKCSFCNVPTLWPSFRWRTGENIATELVRNYEKYGITNFFFTDSLMNGNLKEFYILHETLAKKNLPRFDFSGYAIIRPKRQHTTEMFDILKNNGRHFWNVGVEHGSDAVRHDMRKKFNNDDIDWHLEQSYRIGLKNNLLLLPTWVTETEENHREYLDVFPRWQKYVATETISSVVISPLLFAIRDTPLGSHDYHLDFYEEKDESLRSIFWMNNNNKELDFNERFKRSISVYEQAVKYKYPVLQAEQKLMQLITVMQKYNEIKSNLYFQDLGVAQSG